MVSFEDLQLARQLHNSGESQDKEKALRMWGKFILYDETNSFSEEKKEFASAIAEMYFDKGEVELGLLFLGKTLNNDEQDVIAKFTEEYSRKLLVDEIRGREEINFVRDTRNIFKNLPYAKNNISDVNEAYKSLELLMTNRVSKLIITSDIKNLTVEIKRWFYKDNERILWNKIFPDDTLNVASAAYLIKYKNPITKKDTIFTQPCADGCIIKIFSSN